MSHLKGFERELKKVKKFIGGKLPNPPPPSLYFENLELYKDKAVRHEGANAAGLEARIQALKKPAYRADAVRYINLLRRRIEEVEKGGRIDRHQKKRLQVYSQAHVSLEMAMSMEAEVADLLVEFKRLRKRLDTILAAQT